jgi:exopolysaccharide biosynthesis polyprenyl glycosylphosphotransferase
MLGIDLTMLLKLWRRGELQLGVKRLVDVALSLTLLTLLSPLMLLIAIVVRATSNGPVIFRQERVGKGGRRFTLHKFRTMYVDAELSASGLRARNEMSGPVFKLRDDPRVTRAGRVLRRCSLDELPQLWDVLCGQMSLVGPRPPLPSEVEHYEAWHLDRLSVKPGLTGPWQVSGRNTLDFEEWMRLDIAYVRNWSLKEDLRILIRTIPAVLTGRGAH